MTASKTTYPFLTPNVPTYLTALYLRLDNARATHEEAGRKLSKAAQRLFDIVQADTALGRAPSSIQALLTKEYDSLIAGYHESSSRILDLEGRVKNAERLSRDALSITALYLRRDNARARDISADRG